MTSQVLTQTGGLPFPWYDDFSDGQLRAHALQTRSRIPRQRLAHEISGGKHNYTSLISALRSGQLRTLLRPSRAALLAQVVTAQRLDDTDPEDALLLFEQILATYGNSVLSDEEKLVYVELLDRAGRPQDARRASRALELAKLFPGDAAALEANTALAESEPGSEAWVAAFNELLALDDLDPVRLAPGTAPVLDRLESTSVPASVQGPLVTIIVPTWRPGPWLWTAVRSLTQQTYANLQILIMDDLSGSEFTPRLESLLDMDPRIQIVTSPKNRGTYASRNAAVREHARGEFVTIQDDDDWSHPQRIERQVAFSQERHLAVGMCRAARVNEDMRFVRRAATFIRRGYPTTLVARATFTEVGFWDPVRRNSDFEFIRRVRRSKRPTGDLGKAPMVLQRHREGSLSSGEVWEGYSEQSRRWQNWLSADWHDRCVSAGQRLYMGSGAGLDRPYPAPRGLLRTSRDEPATRVNTLIIADFGKESSSEEKILGLAETALHRGEQVGLLHVEGLRLLSDTIDRRIAELASISSVTVLSWNDDVIADTAHVLNGELLALCESVTSRVSAGSVHLEGEGDGVTSHVNRLLGTESITTAPASTAAPEIV